MKTEKRVLICGSRTWSDERIIHTILDGLYRNRMARYFVVINGRAPGADSIASQWAIRTNLGRGDDLVQERGFLAQWDRYGRAAGPKRNQQMLDEGKPQIVIAFHSDLSKSKGTADMCKRAHKAGIPVYVVGQYSG